MNLQGLKEWFDLNAERAANAFWSLKGDDGRQKRHIFTNTVIKEADDSWNTLVNMIENQAMNGVRKFEIVFKQSKTDPSMTSYILEVPWQFHQQNQQNAQPAIAGIFGPAQAGVGDLYTNMFEQRLKVLQEAHQKDMEFLRRDMEHQRKLEKLEETIEAMAESHKDWLDKILDRMENYSHLFAPAIEGIVTKMFPQVAVSGPVHTHAVPPAQRKAVTPDQVNEEEYEGPDATHQTTTPGGGGIDFNPAISASLTLFHSGDPNPAATIQYLVESAVLPLQKAGFGDPVGILCQVAIYAANNPEQARMILGQLIKPQQTNGDDEQ